MHSSKTWRTTGRFLASVIYNEAFEFKTFGVIFKFYGSKISIHWFDLPKIYDGINLRDDKSDTVCFQFLR